MHTEKNLGLIPNCEINTELQTINLLHTSFYLRDKLWKLFLRFLEMPEVILSRQELCECIWIECGSEDSKNIDNAVHHLRSILKKHNVNAEIVTIHSKGYLFRVISQRAKVTLTIQ